MTILKKILDSFSCHNNTCCHYFSIYPKVSSS